MMQSHDTAQIHFRCCGLDLHKASLSTPHKTHTINRKVFVAFCLLGYESRGHVVQDTRVCAFHQNRMRIQRRPLNRVMPKRINLEAWKRTPGVCEATFVACWCDRSAPDGSSRRNPPRGWAWLRARTRAPAKNKVQRATHVWKQDASSRQRTSTAACCAR